MKAVDFSIRRPVTVTIGAVAAIVFGVVAFRQLATDLLPDITYPSLTLRTTYPGAAPLEVESLVTRPIENAVGVVNNLERVASSSRAEVSEVTLEFRWDTSMDLAALDVRERLDMLVLPEDAEPPVLLRYDPSLDPILRVGLSGEEDLARLRLVAEERVARSLERLGGVAAALVQGGLEEEIQVELDERRISNLGLTVARVASRLAEENVNLTGGRLRDGQTEYMVRTLGELLRPEDLRELVVDSGRGATVRLADVARVYRGHREREIITRIDGRESVEVAVYKAGGTNTVTVSDTVRKSLEEIRRDLAEVDPNLRLEVLTDQARYIRSSVREVLQTALWGGALAIIVLFLFLRSWRTTLVIAAAIPISVVATFFLMYAFGISLNIMSLGGLTLGIGLLVDNAIVVLESVERRRAGGMEPAEAARRGAGEVATAVVASTLTSICVFLPIVFVEGVAAQLFADQAMTVTFSLAVSLLVALTVIPMLASRTFRAEGGAGREAREEPPGLLGRALFPPAKLGAGLLKRLLGALARVVARVTDLPARLFQRVFDLVAAVYRRLLAAVLRRPLPTLAATILLFAASLALYPRLGRELVPELVQGEFHVDVELPPGTDLEVTRRRLARLEVLTLGREGVAKVYGVAGSTGRQGGSESETRENVGRLTVLVEPPFSRQKEEALMESLRAAYGAEEGLEIRFGRPSYFSFKTPVEVEIRGYNLQMLRRLADRLAASMRAIEGVTDVESSTEGGSPELQVRFDRERLAALGVSLEEVATAVRSKVQGTVATEIQREDRTIGIRLRSAEAYRDSARDLENLPVVQQGTTALPLSAVAEVVRAEGPAEIRRTDGERVALVSANLEGRDLGSVAREITAAMEALDLPLGFSWEMGGQRREMETSFASMRLAILLAIFLVYLVMASQFESLLHPLVILVSVPFSVIGMLAILWLFDVTLSVVVLIGAVLLAGLVVNNAIILVDTTNRLRRRQGLPKLEALRAAGEERLRPILMTTATTALGLLPMALGLGEGSELRTPMALTVIGGLVSSTALTLLVIPTLYGLVDRGK